MSASRAGQSPGPEGGSSSPRGCSSAIQVNDSTASRKVFIWTGVCAHFVTAAIMSVSGAAWRARATSRSLRSLGGSKSPRNESMQLFHSSSLLDPETLPCATVLSRPRRAMNVSNAEPGALSRGLACDPCHQPRQLPGSRTRGFVKQSQLVHALPKRAQRMRMPLRVMVGSLSPRHRRPRPP